MKTVEELSQEYLDLLHAVQSGVAFELHLDAFEVENNLESKEVTLPEHSSGSSKHLRTGVNHTLLLIGALEELLIERGVFTKEELLVKILKYTKQEVKRYEALLSGKLGGKPVTLH